MFFFVEAVGLARIDDQIRLHSVTFQAAIEFLALAERVNGIGASLQNESRSFCALRMQERRTVEESGGLFVRDAPKPLVVRRMLLGAVLGNKIGHACSGNFGLEERSLRDGPFTQVATFGPAADSETIVSR